MQGDLIKIKRFTLSDRTAVQITAASMLLPYPVSFLVLAVLCIAVICNNEKRRAVFSCGRSWLLAAFVAITCIVSAIYGNMLGIVCGIGIGIVMTVAQYFKSVMTRELFEISLDRMCSMIPLSAALCILEFTVRYITYSVNGQYIRFKLRCTGFYFNPNYLGVVAATVALICIYKFLSGKSRKKYVFSGICALICIALSQSMFACIELTVAALLLLVLNKKAKYFLILSGCLISAAVAVIALPALFPRLGEAGHTFDLRVRVWRVAFEAFRQTPLFGKGPLTYYHVYEDFIGQIDGVKVWATQHAHNIFFDSLLSYGIIGAPLIWAYIGSFVKDVFRATKNSASRPSALLAISLMFGALIHGMVDIPLLWVQTGVIFMFVIASSSLKE